MKILYFLPDHLGSGLRLPPEALLGSHRCRRFPSGYGQVALTGPDPRGQEVFIWFGRGRKKTDVADRLLVLGLLVDAIRSRSPRTIELVLSYHDYGRATDAEDPGLSAGGRVYNRFLSALPIDRLIHFDLHRWDNLATVRRGRRLLSTLPLWADHLRARIPDLDCLLSPDLGRSAAVAELGFLLGLPAFTLDKRRADGGLPDGLSFSGRRVFIFDDEIVSGATLRLATAVLRRRGAHEVHAGIIYGLCGVGQLEALSFSLSSLTLSNLISQPMPPSVDELDLAGPLLDVILAGAGRSEQS